MKIHKYAAKSTIRFLTTSTGGSENVFSARSVECPVDEKFDVIL